MAFPARFHSTCRSCGRAINPGDSITWSRRAKGKYAHVTCGDTPDASTVSTADVPAPSATPNGADSSVLDVLATALSGRLTSASAPSLDEAHVRTIVDEALATREPIHVAIDKDGVPPVVIEGAHKAFPHLAYLVSTGRPCYLYGQHGTGKSYAARQLANALGLEFSYLSLTKQTPMSVVFGYMDAQGRPVRTVFQDRFEHGGILCIDELDNGAPNLLSALNTPFENGHCAFPSGNVLRHKDFRLIGTGNTSGRGPNPAYPERSPFDAAFGDRFSYLAWETDEVLERSIALAIEPSAGPWVTWIQRIRAWCTTNMPRLAPSPRTSFKLAEFLRDKRLPCELALDAALWHGAARDVRDKVLANCPLPATTWPMAS